jgi:hypothetical protein
MKTWSSFQGFQLAVAVFELEDGFAFDGWSVIADMGAEWLGQVVAAYQAIGLAERAAVLTRVIEAFLKNSGDEEALSEAAGGDLPDLVDDEAAVSKLLAFFREDAEAKFGVLTEEDL